MSNNEPVSVGNWMLTTLILGIPLINLIMLLVWAFSGSTPESKSNFAKASLMWMLIGFIFYGIIMITGVGAGLASGMTQ